MLNLDRTPIDTDWDDIHDLLKDMREFSKSHPEHEFMPADDPGAHYSPRSRTRTRMWLSVNASRRLPDARSYSTLL